MTNDTKIEPALTADEWVWIHDESMERLTDDIGYLWGHVRRDAVAAICLHGQPFGFTWSDVDLLKAHGAEWFPRVGSPECDNLADRIAALLPPRNEQ